MRKCTSYSLDARKGLESASHTAVDLPWGWQSDNLAICHTNCGRCGRPYMYKTFLGIANFRKDSVPDAGCQLICSRSRQHKLVGYDLHVNEPMTSHGPGSSRGDVATAHDMLCCTPNRGHNGLICCVRKLAHSINGDTKAHVEYHACHHKSREGIEPSNAPPRSHNADQCNNGRPHIAPVVLRIGTDHRRVQSSAHCISCTEKQLL
mmetsp:Transcript_9776/g.18903  ORF Transcript_9776/g.18903 Transcript_9776/m.18903 type:complete len:206 (-) Transcript_9776:826-1443(-)